MAKKTVVHVVDDLDQTELTDGSRSVTFALHENRYEIDLSEPNAAKLHDALAPFIAAGRRVNAPGKPTSGQRAGGQRAGVGNVDAAQTRAMREWAKTHGMDVSARGRVSQAIRDAYHSATK